jgi:hypothetical protein
LISAELASLYNGYADIQDEIEILQSQGETFERAIQLSPSGLALVEDPILAPDRSGSGSSFNSLPSTGSDNNDAGDIAPAADGNEADDAIEEEQPEDECPAESASDADSVCNPRQDEAIAEVPELATNLQYSKGEYSNEFAESLAAMAFMVALKRQSSLENILEIEDELLPV